MPRPASSIIARAVQISKTGNITATGAATGYTIQALDELNSILDTVTQTLDFAAAMGQFNFTFNTNLVSSGAGNIISAAPNPLPLDYLRVQTSGGSTGAQRSSKWYLNGVPYDMIEVDLTEWDDQVQQPGIQSYPYFWAKDMSQRAILFNATGDLSTASQTAQNIPSTTGMLAGMSIAGGIGPQSVIVPGTTILSLTSTTLTLSAAPTRSLAGASLMIGYPPVGYPYPPPSGAFAAMIRYQRFMPPLTQTQVNNGAYCWFDDDDFLVEALTAKLMGYSDDARVAEYTQRAAGRLAAYARLADDKANRSQNVELDRRTFGTPFRNLSNTKRIGWAIPLFFATMEALSMWGGGC